MESPPAPARGNPLLRNMGISLAVLVIPILAIVLVPQWLAGGPASIDPSPAYEAARAANRFTVQRPQGLPTEWTITRADVERGAGDAITLRIGYLSPTGGPARLVQSDVPVTSLLPAELGGKRRILETRTVGGRSWQVYPARGDERALVNLQPKVTTLVIGQLADPELNALAASLR